MIFLEIRARINKIMSKSCLFLCFLVQLRGINGRKLKTLLIYRPDRTKCSVRLKQPLQNATTSRPLPHFGVQVHVLRRRSVKPYCQNNNLVHHHSESIVFSFTDYRYGNLLLLVKGSLFHHPLHDKKHELQTPILCRVTN